MSKLNYELEYRVVEAGENHAVLCRLRQALELLGNVPTLIRRLCWVPRNFPVSVNGATAESAEALLIETETDGQVLFGYWCDLEGLIRFHEITDVNTVDFELYDRKDMTLKATISYFENALLEWWADIEPPVSSSGGGGREPKRDYLVHHVTRGKSEKIYLSDDGLECASPFRLYTPDALLGLPFEETSLPELFERISNLAEVAAVSEDWIRFEEIGHLSRMSGIEEVVSDPPSRLRVPLGVFNFFDKALGLRLTAYKLSNEASWSVVTIPR